MAFSRFAFTLLLARFAFLVSAAAEVNPVSGGLARSPDRPNVIFVLADDLGWAELGCYGNRFNETPNLDKLAGQGMRFTSAYAAAPVCSPYRAALLTGQHPARVGIIDYLRPNSAAALSTDQVTIAEMFQANGYRTGMIGKWHLTGYAYHGAAHEVKPRDHGFDWDFAREVKGVGNGANFWPYVFRDQPIRWIDIPDNRLGENEFLVDRMNAEAVDFIERNRDRPFFLYLSHYAPHSIVNGKPRLVQKYRDKHPPGKSSRERCYLCQDQGHAADALNHWASDHNPHLAAMLESIDDGVGQIRDKLHELGIAENTILIFTSDNGGETNVTSNAPLRGGKSQLYEGGIRVPMIVCWPKQVPASSACDQPTVNYDFYPTLLDAAQIQPDAAQKLDGVSMLESWKDPSTQNLQETSRREFYWHYPLDRPHFLGGRSSAAIRDGDWKLIEYLDSGDCELYSLDSDPSEQHDRAAEHFELVDRLKSKLSLWRTSVGARIPSPPLLASTGKLQFADHFSTGQVSDRWFFNKDWSAEKGILRRGDHGTDTTRIFLKETRFRDALIRFDFQFQTTQNIRLVTGSSGHYNAVIHLHPDHFFIQTAQDPSGPYFSYRHGECAYDFQQNRWYTMTVEFIGDQLVAHVDREHLAYAHHPILDNERTYFAFQVDRGSAAFDNVQILQVTKQRQQPDQLQHVLATSNRHPVPKTLEEQFQIQKSNAHEWLYQRHPQYRKLVQEVDRLDERNKQLYPKVFRSHKEVQKQIAAMRKQLHAEDPRYKEMLFATHRAARAIDAFLIGQQPAASDLPDSRRKREVERLRRQHRGDPEFQNRVAAHAEAQQRLQQAYPQLFVTNEEISANRKQQREAMKDDPEFKRMVRQRADAYRAQQAYLFQHDSKLDQLRGKLDQQDK